MYYMIPSSQCNISMIKLVDKVGWLYLQAFFATKRSLGLFLKDKKV